MKLDRISDLDDDVTQQILTCLPIRDAVRTRILSRTWKSKSDNLPCLVFDDQYRFSDRNKFENVVDQVLALQIGSIHTFKISFQYKGLDSANIDRWIYRLSRSSVKNFTLQNCRGRLRPYNVSSRSFMCQELIDLELHICLLNPPSTFKGFRTLKTLNMQMVNIAEDVLEKMIACSPLLERLIICDFSGIKNLKFDATKLQYLTVKGAFEDIDIGMNTLNLVHVSNEQQEAASIGSTCTSFLKFFSQLSRIEDLSIDGFFLESSVGALQGELPKPYLCLRFLFLSIYFNKLDDILAAVRLLRSSPALKELEISVRTEASDANAGDRTFWLNDNKDWEFTQLRLVKVTNYSGVKAKVDFINFLLLSSPALQQLEILARKRDGGVRRKVSSLFDDSQNGAFNQLRVVKVSDISGVKAELALIRFLLLNSPVLEKMILRPVHHSGRRPLLRKLLQYRRASSQAEIKYLDPLKHVQPNAGSTSYSSSESDEDDSSSSDSD